MTHYDKERPLPFPHPSNREHAIFRDGVGIHTYYPGEYVDNHDLTGNPDEPLYSPGSGRILTAQDVFNTVGAERRWVAGPHEDTGYMAAKVIAPLAMAQHGEVGALYIAYSFPVGEHMATRINRELHLNARYTHDAHAACSGVPHALAHMLDHEDKYRGEPFVVASAEKYHPHLLPITRTIFSDGATALYGVYAKTIRPISAVRSTKDDFSEIEHNSIFMPAEEGLVEEEDPSLYVASPHPKNAKLEKSIPPDKFYMNGGAVIKAVKRVVPTMTTRAIVEAGNPEIKRIIPHQASNPVLHHYRSALPNDLKDKVYINVRDGNWSSGSTIKALGELLETGEVQKGDNVVLVGFGAGMYGCAVVVRIGE